MSESRFTYRVTDGFNGVSTIKSEDGVVVEKTDFPSGHYAASLAVAEGERWVDEQEAAYALGRLVHPAGKGRTRLMEPAVS